MTITNSTIEPSKQQIYIDPGSGRLFDFNTVNSRVYLSRTINDLLRVLGTDCVLHGLNIVDATITNNDILVVKVAPGKAIIDTTLIDIQSETDLTLDLTSYNNNGYVALVLSYKYVESFYQNSARLRLVYVNNKGIPADCWNPDRDRVVICKLSFDIISKSVIENNCCPTGLFETTSIQGTIYDICPKDNITKNIMKIVDCTKRTSFDYTFWWVLGTEVPNPNPKISSGFDINDLTLGRLTSLD
jgi:hypothetical protein